MEVITFRNLDEFNTYWNEKIFYERKWYDIGFPKFGICPACDKYVKKYYTETYYQKKVDERNSFYNDFIKNNSFPLAIHIKCINKSIGHYTSKIVPLPSR